MPKDVDSEFVGAAVFSLASDKSVVCSFQRIHAGRAEFESSSVFGVDAVEQYNL